MSSAENGTKEDVKAICLEIYRKEDYHKWKQNPEYVGEALAQHRQPNECPEGIKERFEITHLN